MMQERYGINLGDDDQCQRCMFSGDSPSDAPMFAHFPLSVDAANVLDVADRLPHPPDLMTQQPDSAGSAGFVELTQHLLKP